MNRASLALLLAAFSVPSLADDTMTMDGLGKVRLGMTLHAASHALGAKLVVSPFYDAPWECSYATRFDGRDSNIGYMLRHGRIVRIDVYDRSQGDRFVDLRTAAGIGIGSSEAAIRNAYGRRAIVGPNPYGDKNDHYYRVSDTGGKYELIFETWGGKVSQFRVGERRVAEYIEGCS